MLLPCVLYAIGVRNKQVELVQFTAVLTVLGVFLNRMNVSIIAFNYHLPLERRYFPSWMEFTISLAIITLGVITYRWIVLRIPILFKHKDFEYEH